MFAVGIAVSSSAPPATRGGDMGSIGSIDWVGRCENSWIGRGACRLLIWLVVEPTHLKNISQMGNLPQVGVKIKNVWNHHLVIYHIKKKKPMWQKKTCNINVGGWWCCCVDVSFETQWRYGTWEAYTNWNSIECSCHVLKCQFEFWLLF